MIALAAAAMLFAAPPAKSPVAVMPFKNLGGDASLDWMAAGIADTMISDLRRSKVAVVERDQIERALGEILTSGAAAEAASRGTPLADARDGTAASTAAKVGRLVGAKTVVLGGYQQAGKQLRINARFVEVETGVVQEAAKATGPSSDPFAVQDQIVDQLLGRKPGATAPRKTTAKTPDAYKLYAQAATIASDAERRPLLEKSLALDPGFVYSKDALATLEQRIAALSAARDKDAIAHEAELRAVALDATKPAAERATAANELLNSLMQGRRYHQLLKDSASLDGTDLTLPIGGFRIAESAAFGLVLGNSSLRRLDPSMHAGERFLKDFPRSNYFGSVKVMVESDLKEKQARAAAPEKEMPEVEKLLAKAAAAKPGSIAAVSQEAAACRHASQKKLHALAITRCHALYEQYMDDPRPDASAAARAAAVDELRARYELGQIVEARALAAALLAAKNSDDITPSVTGLLTGLATDSPEDVR